MENEQSSTDSHSAPDLRSRILSSSTKDRIHALQTIKDRVKSSDLDEKPLLALLQLLQHTVPLYGDRASRQAVHDALQEILLGSCAQSCLHSIAQYLSAEASKAVLAPGTLFSLLEWASTSLQVIAKHSKYWEDEGLAIAQAQAALLDRFFASNQREARNHSVLVLTRRSWRSVSRSPKLKESAVVSTIQKLTAKQTQPTAGNAVLLGVLAGVYSRISALRDIVATRKSDYYAFYSREIISARSPPPPHLANALHDFFVAYATPQDLSAEVCAAVEKGLLRSPEVVLNGVLPPLVDSIPTTIDLSDIFKQHLMKSLLSNVKSTNQSIRDGALRAFQSVAKRSRDEKTNLFITEEVIKSLKEVKAADQRSIYAIMLASVTLSVESAASVLSSIQTIASKEANEAALTAQLKGFSTALIFLIAHDTAVDAAVAKAFAAGLTDKKQAIRRAWAVAFGDTIWKLPETSLVSQSAIDCFSPVLEKFQISWDEAKANPIAASTTGSLVVSFIAYAILGSKLGPSNTQTYSKAIDKFQLAKNAAGQADQVSFLFNHRAYSKLTNAEDLKWWARALAASTQYLDEDATSTLAVTAWSQSFVFALTSTSVPGEIKREAAQILAACYSSRPRMVGSFMIRGLWTWLANVTADERDTAAVTAKSGHDLSSVVLAISPQPKASQDLVNGEATRQVEKDEVLDDQLIDLLILCRDTLIPKARWIDLCLRCGKDPHALVSGKVDRCLDLIENNLKGKSSPFSSLVHDAACEAAAELAFVAPAEITDRLIDMFRSNLDPSLLRDIGPTEAAIYRMPEGQTFVDVLSQKTDAPIPTKGKDAETLKWEQELRQQLASKQTQKKKLTSEEQAKVKAQLAKEASIRNEVAQVVLRLQAGIGIIDCLARGPPTESESWVGAAANSLYQVISAGAGLLVGDSAALTYLNLASQVAPRLGQLRKFIGVATLRGQGAQLPADLEQESLGDLATRVLYRLRLSCEQRPFDLISLSYILPLVQLVLEERGIAKKADDEADEQITLALEFLSLHTHHFASSSLPRKDIVALLVRSMQRYNQHYRLLKECLSSICHALAPDARKDEIDVFLRGCIVPEVSVRTASLQCIDADLELPEGSFVHEIWLAKHDEADENVELADTIWEENALQVESSSPNLIIPYLSSKDRQLRTAAGRAMASCVAEQMSTFDATIENLEALYKEKAVLPRPELDSRGMPVKKDLSDPWEARQGIAIAFSNMAGLFDDKKVIPFISFLLESGPLGDRNASVRDAMVEAATTVINKKGSHELEKLINIFETTLSAPASTSAEGDLVNEAAIILYGALAGHLKPGDGRIPQIITRLLSTLSTPSETVQYAIAACLPALIQSSDKPATEYLTRVMDELLHGKKYAARRGAAYGLAGIVRGKGISVLREARIMSSLRAATEDKKDQTQRQGAFLAYELLSLVLGPVFEPYVIQIVPQLLTGFGDASPDVRDACLDAAKTCFATLSSFGVKRTLPILLEGLDEVQWRSKKGACESLGAMAYLAPQQLAISLPDIIPPLTFVLNDSHKEVRGAANRSLQRFGDVISNPEVKSLVNILLKALSDPTKYTDEALDSLLKVNFVHYLDAPSLALVVRILERGLGDRSQTKRKSSQIIGSLAHLTERKDLTAHLPILVNGLRVAAVDPVPATRATSSKALGSLVEKLGEDALPDLIPSLMAALKTDTGAGDRLGSAQALSEVLAGLGISRLEETLPSILQNVSSSKSAVREGFMSLFIFLPACFGNSFANYLGRIIPPILSGLADEVESIRETALRAGRLLVKNFATKAIDLLLPELQRGLGDDNYRIRLSSVELVGDLLFNLTGISGKTEQDEEIEEGATQAGQSLLETLGEEKRNNVLSALYISRCDTSGLVRSAAIAVWKALVATPRTLREITPTLTQVLIRRLASSNMEQKVIASNALGELIRKAGETVLTTLLPTLEESLETSTDADAKQGICIALKELITSASPETLEDHETKLITIVKSALISSNADVREAAAEAFDALQQLFGKRVIDQILPNLLGLLQDKDEAENSLAALLTLLDEETRSNVILPNLLPTLLKNPISTFNARALGSLASVAGSAMTRRLSNVLNTLLDNIIFCKEDDRRDALEAAFDSVILSVDEYDGLNTLMSVILAMIKHDDHKKRRIIDSHMATFFEKADMDYSRYYADLIRALLISFDDRDIEVVKAACAALTMLTTKKLKKEEMESLVTSTRQTLGQVGTKGHDLPGFSLPKGINAILPIFLQGLINGTPEQRVTSALAISEILDKTPADALKPFVTQITGPLIRVVSERSVDVKAAILLTLNNLLEKIPLMLRPFLPQLQRTFTKALADTTSDVLRIRAAKALGTLITLMPRIDPLIGELVTGSKTSDPGVKNAMQKALYEVVSKVGANMGDASRTSIIALIDDDSASDDATQITNARLLGALIKVLSQEVSAGIIKSRVLTNRFTRPSVLALNSILLESPSTLTGPFEAETVSTICRGIGDSQSFASEHCVLAAGKYLLAESSNKSFETTKSIFEALIPVMQPGAHVDSRRLAMVVIRTVAREHQAIVRPHLAMLAPPIFASVRDMVIPIKLSAEAAFLAVFDVVDEDSNVFDKYMAGPGAELQSGPKRSMQDYFKRVAMRLASQARERREAEGGQHGLGKSNDEIEDEREIYSVGKVELEDASIE